MRTAARGVAVTGVILLILTLRMVTGAHTELVRGDRYRASGDLDSAMMAYRRSASWYVPGNPYSTEALDRLSQLAEECPTTECALPAWRSIRGAILNTRSVYVPHRSRLGRANSRIAALASEGALPSEQAELREELEAELTAVEEPHLGYTLMALAGWIAWTLGAFLFSQRAIDEEDRILPQPARLWGTVIVTGFGLFALGLSLA